MFDPDFWKAHYGNVASVVGLALTVVGFIVTWLKQQSLKEATEAAQTQALKVVHSLAEHLAMADLHSASNLCQELRHFVGAGNLDKAADRAERLRNQLGVMVMSQRLNEDEKQFLGEAVDDANLIFQAADRASKQSNTQLSPAAVKKLDGLIIQLNAIDGRLKNALLEVTDGQRQD